MKSFRKDLLSHNENSSAVWNSVQDQGFAYVIITMSTETFTKDQNIRRKFEKKNQKKKNQRE